MAWTGTHKKLCQSICKGFSNSTWLETTQHASTVLGLCGGCASCLQLGRGRLENKEEDMKQIVQKVDLDCTIEVFPLIRVF